MFMWVSSVLSYFRRNAEVGEQTKLPIGVNAYVNMCVCTVPCDVNGIWHFSNQEKKTASEDEIMNVFQTLDTYSQ